MGAKDRLLGRTTAAPSDTAAAVNPNSAKGRLLGLTAPAAAPSAQSTAPAPSMGASQPEGLPGGNEEEPLWRKVLGLLDRPRNALWVAAKHTQQDTTPLYDPAMWKGLWRGLTGEETYRGRDFLQENAPDWSKAHPTAATWAGAGIDLSTDPTVLAGSAAGRVSGAVLKAGAGAALGAPDLVRAAEVLVPPAASEAARLLAPIARFGAQKTTPVLSFLRNARGAVKQAGQDGANEALAIGEGLTPDSEQAARRLLERSPNRAVRDRIAAHAGTPNVAPVDVALQETAQEGLAAARAQVPAARRFSIVNPAEARLDRVMQTAQEAQGYVQDRLAQVPPARTFRPVNMGERNLNQVMEAARNGPVDAETTVNTSRQARQYLMEVFGASKQEVAGMSDGEAVQLAIEAQQSRTLPTAEDRFARAAMARGTTPEQLFAEAGEDPLQRIRRLGERSRMARTAGVDTSPLPGLARPQSVVPREPSAMEIYRRTAQAYGEEPSTLLAQAQARPGEFLRERAATPERLRIGQAAGVVGPMPHLARPDTLIPQAVDNTEAAVQRLMQYGLPEPVARAAVQGRQLTNRIVQESEAAGLPMQGRGEYFPRVQDQTTNVGEVLKNPSSLLKRLRQRLGGHDPHAEARTLAPELGIEELGQLRDAGADIPKYREDFAIPLAVRNQRAKEALEAHKQIRAGFQRFGQGIEGRTPQQLADEGLVAVKYSPKNSNQPFEFARSAMPADPENWVAVPRDLVGGMQRFQRQFLDDQGVQQVATIWHELHKLWKSSVTKWRPAFYVNNGIGGMVNNLLSDVTNPAAYTSAMKAVAGKAGALQTSNGPMPYADALRLMERHGVTDAGLTRSLLKASNLAEVQAEVKGGLGKLGEAAAGVETFNRASIFFDRLIKGATPEVAAADTLAAHFDYSDEALTGVERGLREVVPFYLWLKNNAEFQLKKFIEKPQVYSAYVRTKETLSAPGREDRPSYQQEAVPTGMSIMGKPLAYETSDPIADAVGLVENPKEKLLGAISPLLREPLQQAGNVDFMTGRPIERFPGEVRPLGPWNPSARTTHWLRALGGAPVQVGSALANVLNAAGHSDRTLATPQDYATLIRYGVPGVQVADADAAQRERVAKIKQWIEQQRMRARQEAQLGSR